MRLPRRAIAAIVVVCASAASVLLRLPATLPLPTFVGACQRLQASGIPVSVRDWFCLPGPLSARVAYALALLLVAVGLVLPCAILAATGRRWTSLLPLAVAPFLNVPVFATSWWDAGSHGSGSLLVATNVVLLAAPVVAIWLIPRPRPRRERQPVLAAALAVGVACSLASFGVERWAHRIAVDHWFALDVGTTSIRYLIPAGISMALFGMMLGTDRRWWPWSLVPTALLLSMAPSAALDWGPQLRTDWSFFGGVLPLVVLGLIWSTWRPVTTRLSPLFLRAREALFEDVAPAPDALPAVSVSFPRRGTLGFNAAACALLVVSLAMFRADPLPIQVSASLPTYLGERVQADDVRTKLDLRQAIDAMEAFAVTNGSYRGFDAKAARLADPSLAWSDGHLASDGSTTVPALTMSIEAATGRTARVVASSGSGRVFCIERTADGSIRYGNAQGKRYGEVGSSVFERAIARCGTTPWSGAAVRMLDTATMCDGLDPAGGYLICRMVQALITNTMRQTKPG